MHNTPISGFRYILYEPMNTYTSKLIVIKDQEAITTLLLAE